MTQPTGRLVARILIAVAEWEGDIISERTKAGLAQAKASGGADRCRSVQSRRWTPRWSVA